MGRVYAIIWSCRVPVAAGGAGEAASSIFRNAAILGVVDVVCFGVCAAVGYEVAPGRAGAPDRGGAPLVTAIVQSLVFVPVLVPGVVLVAGVLFEVNTSSKFAASDSINWLPVTQAEYVAASTMSIAYAYSVVPSVIMGLTLRPRRQAGLPRHVGRDRPSELRLPVLWRAIVEY